MTRWLKMEKARTSLVRPLQRGELLGAADLTGRWDDGGWGHVFFGQGVRYRRTSPAGDPAGAKVWRSRFHALVRADDRYTTLADLEFAPSGNSDEDVRNLTQAIMDAHERFMRQYPDQWYMFRGMWPRRRQRATTLSGMIKLLMMGFSAGCWQFPRASTGSHRSRVVAFQTRRIEAQGGPEHAAACATGDLPRAKPRGAAADAASGPVLRDLATLPAADMRGSSGASDNRTRRTACVLERQAGCRRERAHWQCWNWRSALT